MIRSLFLLSLAVRVWALPSPEPEDSTTDGNYSVALVTPPDLDLTFMKAIADDYGKEKGDDHLDMDFDVYEITYDGLRQVTGELIIGRPTRFPLACTEESKQVQQDVHLAIRLDGDWGIRYVSHPYLSPIIGGERVASHKRFVRTSTTKDGTTAKTTFTLDPEASKLNKFSVFYVPSRTPTCLFWKCATTRGVQPLKGDITLVIKDRDQLEGKLDIAGVNDFWTFSRPTSFGGKYKSGAYVGTHVSQGGSRSP